MVATTTLLNFPKQQYVDVSYFFNLGSDIQQLFQQLEPFFNKVKIESTK